MTRPPGPARRVVKSRPLLIARLQHVTRAIIGVEVEGCAVAFARGLFDHRGLVKIVPWFGGDD
jgi:hypothetical protein